MRDANPHDFQPSPGLFTASELDAPPPRSALHGTRERLYQAAEQARLRLIDPLLRAIAAEIGATLDESGEPLRAIERPGVVLVVARIKDVERATEKVARDYRGDFSRLADAVRATIVVDDYASVPTAVGTLRASCEEHGWRIVRAKDRFANPTDSGYRDALVNLAAPSEFLCEVQIATKPMLRAKEATHESYEELGALGARIARERRPPSDEELRRMELLAEKMREIHEQGWNETIGAIMESNHEAL